MRTAALVSLALLLSFPARADKREQGQLVLDGIPEIPRRIVDRQNQYNNVRGAGLLDWTPDGKGILVATRFADTPQLHLVSAPGAYRQQLTFFREPVTEAAFDPRAGDGGFVFRMDQGGGELYQYYWYDRAGGQHALLTDGKSRNEGLVVSSAGGAAAWSSTRRNGKDFDIWTLTDHDPKTAKLVKEVSGQWNVVDWSPDDTRLLLHHFVSINESSLHVLDLASGATTEINPTDGKKKIAYQAAAFLGKGAVVYSADEDSEFSRLTRYDLATGKKEVLTPTLAWDVTAVTVSQGGKWLAFAANEGGTSALYLAAAAAPKKARRVDLEKGVIGGLRFDRAAKRLAFSMSTAGSTSDVYAVAVAPAGARPRRWTFSEVGGLDPRGFVAPTLVEYPSFDQRKIPAWYYLPRGAGAAKRAPVIINIHGGPEAQAMASFSSSIQYWTSDLGAAVLVPNVRGSSGYGKSYLLLDNGMAREDSVKDLGALLDWIATRPELDASRVAVIGGSYGGYMVLAAMAAYGDRLKCGVDIVGISNFVTFLENTEEYRRDLRRAEYGDERDPRMKEFLLSISPTTHAGKISKPLFVAQGANDPRVPASEAEQIVKTVRKAGGRVWYLLARDEGHGFQKKVNRDTWQNAVGLFFADYLLK